jgi:hypothetical protein
MNNTEPVVAPRLPPSLRGVGERQMLIKEIFVQHDRFNEAFAAIRRAHYPVIGGEPDYGSISVLAGESRAGKSYAARRYMKEFLPIVGEGGMSFPVLYVDIPIDGQRAMLESLADALALKFSLRVNTPGLVTMILKGLKQQKVELLILDEVNTIVHPSNKRGISYALNLFRKILNECRLNIVCIGLEETYDLLAADPQLTGRGGLPCEIVRPYSWASEEEQMLFRLLCDEFDRLLPFTNRSNLKSVWFAHRLFYSSKGGNIGRLKDFLYSAGCLAINDASEAVEVRHLAQAYERTKARGVEFNPWVHDMENAPKATVNLSKSGLTPSQVFNKKSQVKHAA